MNNTTFRIGDLVRFKAGCYWNTFPGWGGGVHKIIRTGEDFVYISWDNYIRYMNTHSLSVDEVTEDDIERGGGFYANDLELVPSQLMLFEI